MSGEEVTFGRFRFDLGRRQLSRDGIPVRLGSRALDVLFVLAAARGNVITKDELLARVWPGQVVEENNLQARFPHSGKHSTRRRVGKATWLPCRAGATASSALLAVRPVPRFRTSRRSPCCPSRT